MSDSWPASPPGDDASNSLAGQAFEVERALKALEAVDAFRAEAAALRAELQAVRASGTLAGRGPRRRSGLRPGSVAPEGVWRLAAECAVIIGAAVVAWAVHLGRVGILLTLGGTWVVVAVFEAVASGSSQPRWVPPPAAASLPPVHAVAPPPTPAAVLPEIAEPAAKEVGWPSRLEPVEPPPEPALVVEPEPVLEPETELEPEPEVEPVVFFPEVEPDGGPSVGAFAVLEEAAELLGARRRRRWWPRFRRRERPELLEAAQLEPAGQPIDVLEPEPETALDDGPSIGAFVALEEPVDEVSEAEPLELLEQEPEAEPADPEYGWASRLEAAGLQQQPEPVAEAEPLLEPEAEQRSRGWRILSRSRETPADAEVGPVEAEPAVEELELELIAALEPELEPEPEPGPEPEPEPLYAFSAIEPDGGPSIGAFTLLEEATVLPEQPLFDSPLPPRMRRLRLRRRRRVRS